MTQPVDEAEFWKLKYYEQLVHSTQIIQMLMRPLVGQVVAQRAAAVQQEPKNNGHDLRDALKGVGPQ